MGLFGKKKSPEEILAEGRTQYENGDLKKAFLTLHGLAGKGNPQACYYVGRIYLERKEKILARSFLITAAKGGVPDAAQWLAKEFGIRDYLPKEAASQPTPVSVPRPQGDGVPSVDDLLEELEETGKLIQETKSELKQAEKKMGGVGKISRPKPQPAMEKKDESVPVTQAVPAKNPVAVPAEKTEDELSREELSPTLSPNDKSFDAWYEKNGAEFEAEDAYAAGEAAYEKGDYEKAIPLFEKAAEKGQEEAVYALRRHKQMEEAKAAASRGDAQAQFQLATFYEVPDAAMWLDKAAAQGHKGAVIAKKLFQNGTLTSEERGYVRDNYGNMPFSVRNAYDAYMRKALRGL